MQEWIVPSVLGALALVLAVVLMLGRARTERELRAAHAEAASLRARLDDLERRVAAVRHREPAEDAPEYVITHLGEEAAAPRHAGDVTDDDGAVARVEPALFADLVLRETVVRAASLAHGMRVALAPEVRNRIRFEVRREIRRARKRRRAELKEARRQYDARDRATDDEDAA